MFESVYILDQRWLPTCWKKCINGITANKEVCEGYVGNSTAFRYLPELVHHHHNGDIVW